MLPLATSGSSLHRRHHHRRAAASPTVAVATPTARPEEAGVDYVRLALERAKREVVTVQSTLAGQPTQVAAEKKAIPIGPIVGGIVAGVLIVLLAGGFWWWWVANKPRVVAQREARAIPKTAPGRVPPPISTRDSSRSNASPSTAKSPHGSSPLSEKQPSYPLGPIASPSSSKSRPVGNGTSNLSPKAPVSARSVSAESQLNLLPSSSPSSCSHEERTPTAVPVMNRYTPSKPSPLAAGAASAAPKWGDVPFVSNVIPPLPPPPAQSTSSPPPPPPSSSLSRASTALPVYPSTSTSSYMTDHQPLLPPSSSFSSSPTDPFSNPPLPSSTNYSSSLAPPLASSNPNRTSASSVQSAQSAYSQTPSSHYPSNSPTHTSQERFSQQTTGAFEYDDGGGHPYRSSAYDGSGLRQSSQSCGYASPQEQQQQRLSSPQQGWDQGGYGPRYEQPSGYPSEELDEYYGASSRPGSWQNGGGQQQQQGR